ncbi:MAG: restriction endonuclease [Mangrovibacterium sp.]
MDPYKFEILVIDFLQAMGYGGNREEAAQVTKKSGDGGIDGIINEDRLGLDKISVQAKKWEGTVTISAIGLILISSIVGGMFFMIFNQTNFLSRTGFGYAMLLISI